MSTITLRLQTLSTAVFLCLISFTSPGQGRNAVLENAFLTVTWEANTGRLTLKSKPSGRVVINDGQLSEAGGSATVVAEEHPVFGKGEAIEISHPSGNRDSVTLFPQLPFALIRHTLHNRSNQPAITRQVRPLSMGVDLGTSANALKTLGTGGLLAPDKNPGSYVWLAVVEPQSRRGLVFGWLTHERGSGVLFSKVEGETVRVEAQTDYGRLRVAPGRSEALETLAVGYFEDARLGLEAWADAVARVHDVHLPPQPVGYCTWYSSPHGGASDETHLAELSAFAATNLAPFGFSVVQIDDKWQAGITTNGPKRNFTTHDPRGPYPGGMKAAADHIKSLGLVSGIWFMPFAGTYYDPYFKDHQDWFVKDERGRPFETRWGGTCLDLTHPGAREHLRGLVRRIGQEWGYTYFKLDGLWTGTGTRLMYVNEGYKDDHIGEATFQNPDKTHLEAYRDGLRLVRKTAGRKVFLLGCCAPQNMRSYGGAFGLVDAMRIGPDNGHDWGGLLRGPTFGSRHYFLHGRVWYNDPDPVYVRANVPLAQAQLICSWVALSGQLNLSSEWLPGLPAERLEILKRTMPSHGLLPQPVDLFENPIPRLWLLRDDRGDAPRYVLGVFNWNGDQPARIEEKLERIGLPAGEYVGFDYWANRFMPPVKERLSVDVPPASCRIMALRPVATRPLVVSTSRHVTQGVVDVISENWDAEQNQLTGRSRVVAGDTYELRIVVPEGANSWQITEGVLAGAEPVTLAVQQNGSEVRARCQPARSGEVDWRIKFRRTDIQSPPPSKPAGLKAAAEIKGVRVTWDKDASLGYRITRVPGTNWFVSAAELVDREVQPGATYTYTIQGRNWPGVWSEAATVQVTVPDRLRLPPPPPSPAMPLSDLKPISARTGWGRIGNNQSCAGRPLVVNGRTYAKGMGVHASSTLVYAVPAGMKRFVAVVGLDDEEKSDERASVVFKVLGDVQEMGEPAVVLAESPLLSSATTRFWHFNVELSQRTKEVRLVVEDGGDGIAADHADWVEAGFSR